MEKRKKIKHCKLLEPEYSDNFHEIVHVIAYTISDFANHHTANNEETINCTMEMMLAILKHLFVDIYASIDIIQSDVGLLTKFVNNFTSKMEVEIIELLQSNTVKKLLKEHYLKEHGEFH